MSLPFNEILPLSGAYIPAIVERRSVLPDPEGPTSAIYSPAPIFKFIFFSEKLPHVLEIFLISNKFSPYRIIPDPPKDYKNPKACYD